MKQLWKARGMVPVYHFRKQYESFISQQQSQKKHDSFIKLLQTAYNINQKLDSKLQKAKLIQENAVFTHHQPIKAILAAYMQQKITKFPNEQLIGQTFLHLSKAKQLQTKIYWDVDDIQDDASFDVLIQDALKYVTSYQVLAQIAQSVSPLQLHSIVDTIIAKGFASIERSTEIPIELIESLFQEEVIDNNQINQEFKELDEFILLCQQDTFNLIQSVEEIRNVYKKLVVIQNKDIFKNEIQLNLDMMEFEETLLEIGLLAPNDLSGNYEDSMDLAFNFITQGKTELKQFLQQLLKLKINKKYKEIQIQQHKKDLGQLLLGLSGIGNMLKERILNPNYTKIVNEFQRIFPLLKDSSLDIAQAYADLGLFQESHHFLKQVQITPENFIQYVQICLEINEPQCSLDSLPDPSILSSSQLIQLSIAQIKYDQIQEIYLFELNNRFQNILYINELDYESRIRLADLAHALKLPDLLPIVYEEYQSEFFKIIVDSFPQNKELKSTNTLLPHLLGNVYLVDSDNCSARNELTGYLAFRIKNLGCQHICIREFINQDKDSFRSLIQRVFKISQQSIQEFQQLNEALTTFQNNLQQSNQVTENLLNEMDFKAVISAQLIYYSKKALSLLNQFHNADSKNQQAYLQHSLQATLIDITKRAKLANIDLDLSSFITKSNPKVKYPKWYGLVPTEAIYNSQDSLEGFKVSLLSQEYIMNEEYCQYSDIFNRLKLSGLYQLDGVLPNHKQLRKQHTIGYPLGWRERKQNEQLNAFMQYDQQTYKPDASDFFIVNLLNLKAELKSGSLGKISEDILNLNIWDKLLEEKINNNKMECNGVVIQRSGHELLKSLLRQDDYSQSIKYLNEKHKENEALDRLIEMRNEIIQKVGKDVGQNNISDKQAQQINDKVNQHLIKKIDDIRGELKQQHTSMYYREKQNFIDILFGEKEIKKLEFSQNYDEYTDVDILLGQSDPLKFLNIKRSRAEDKILLYRILLRIQEGQQLCKNEQIFLKQLDYYQPKLSITQMTVNDLSEKDQQYFKSLVHSDITQFQEYSLSELIFELSTMFDNQLFQDILYKKHCQSNGIQYQLRRKDSKLLIKAEENKIWNKAQQFNSQELSDIQQMVKVPSVITWVDQKKRSQYNNQLDQAIKSLNNVRTAQQDIFTYVKTKFEENTINIDLVEENTDIFNEIFKLDQIDSHTLHSIVEELLSRFYILRYHRPSFLRQVIKQILLHPLLNNWDKKNIHKYADILQVDFGFNSRDILQLNANKEENQQQKYLENVSYPYGEKLWNHLSI